MHLMQPQAPSEPLTAPTSRRTFLRRAAVVGSAAYVVPVGAVLTMTASSASAASGGPEYGVKAEVIVPDDSPVQGNDVDSGQGVAVGVQPQDGTIGGSVQTPDGGTTGVHVQPDPGAPSVGAAVGGAAITP